MYRLFCPMGRAIPFPGRHTTVENMESSDVLIIGAGIVGLATAYQLGKRRSELTVTLVEKEAGPAVHQTGHNSGVLHSGIYYKPGSLKSVNCREGKAAMEAFCRDEGIAHEICGKVIVALSDGELPAMERIYRRGQENGVRCEIVSAERLRELEPHAAGVRAIHVPGAGIVDFKQVCERLAERVAERTGNRILYSTRVRRMHRDGSAATVVETDKGEFRARWVVNCAGLHSDRVAAASGVKPPAKIVPFRGEYFEIREDAKHLCRNLIYPVPDPDFPFLGVHFTRMIGGGVECGPNAVLALGRECYGRFEVNLPDLLESLRSRGFQRMARRYWKMGLGEMWRSYNKAAFVRALRRLVPEIRAEHLEAAPAGIRAQAVTPEGDLVDDFLIVEGEGVINVCNAPSPAATSSLNIGKTIVERLAERL